jgi:hypothetical protein
MGSRVGFWLVPAVETFPRSQLYLLGDRIQSAVLDVVERLIEATYTRSLKAASLGIEKLRVLFRLATDLRALDRRRYELAERELGYLCFPTIRFSQRVRTVIR